MINRGFDVLIGKTITKVNASAVNIVYITTSDGQEFEINADEQHYGIAVVYLLPKEA